MKKVYYMLLAALCVVTVAGAAYAAKAKASNAGTGKASPSYTLKVNGKIVEPDDHALSPYEVQGAVMVPLRQTAEALGYAVSWMPEEKAVRVEDGIQWALVKSGSQAVQFTGKLKIINLTQEVDLPAPIQTRKGVTYVPASLFEPFFNEVVVKEGSVSISAQMSTIQ